MFQALVPESESRRVGLRPSTLLDGCFVVSSAALGPFFSPPPPSHSPDRQTLSYISLADLVEFLLL